MTDHEKTKHVPGPGMGRRRFLAAAGAAAVGPLILIPRRARASGRVVVVTWGGELAAVKRKVYYQPFTKETGIEVVEVEGPDLAKIRVQVQTKQVEWDLVDLVNSWIGIGESQGLYEPIDTSIVPVQRLMPTARRKFEIASYFYAGGICFATDRIAPDKRPQTWRQFWDVDNFPGNRGLRNRIGETLEIALMADGVPPAQVYPCDIERGFKSLDRIKPHIKLWVAQTPQTTQLVESGELDFDYTYVSRVHDAAKAGVPIGFSFKNDLIGPNWMGIVKGTPRRVEAMRLLEFFTRPDRQLAFCNATGQAPSIAGLRSKLSPSILPWVPDPQSPSNLILSCDWWTAKRQEQLSGRFQEWLMT